MNTWSKIREWFMGARDPFIWVVALGLIVYEAVWYPGDPRFQLLSMYAGMLGLPYFLKKGDKEPNPQPEPRPETRQ